MYNNFRLITPGDASSSMLTKSYQHLRYLVFYKKLKWRNGLIVTEHRETDEYDNDNANYLVYPDKNGKVVAGCRLISTTNPYMLADHYSEFVDKIPLPRTHDVWEITRFCYDPKADLILGCHPISAILAAANDFANRNNISFLISLTICSYIDEINENGWLPDTLGEVKQIKGVDNRALLYTMRKNSYQFP